MKRNVNKISNFSPKPWTSHFGKMPILWVFELMFSLSRKACLLYKLLYLFSRSITWEYRGLQGVTGGYKRLQVVSRGDGGYRRLQRIIEAFSN